MMSEKYVDLLVAEYVRRKTQNERYSERSFAKSLGLSPAYLKLIFQNKRVLSPRRAAEVASRLPWSERERIQFCQLNYDAKDRTRNRKQKVVHTKYLAKKDFHELSDWYYFAILELFKLKMKALDADQIAKVLNISKTVVKFSIEKLLRAGLLGNDPGGGFKAQENYEVPSISSEGIRNFHSQMLEKAKAAVFTQSFEQRDLRGLTLAFEKKRMKEAKKYIENFVNDFERKFGKGHFDSVYQLNLAFFRLDEGEE